MPFHVCLPPGGEPNILGLQADLPSATMKSQSKAWLHLRREFDSTLAQFPIYQMDLETFAKEIHNSPYQPNVTVRDFTELAHALLRYN